MKKWLFLGGFIIVALYTVYWVYSTSFITITVGQAQPNQNITYTITNQKTNKATATKTSATTFKKRVKRGSYQILVQQNDTSSLNLVESAAFLRTTNVEASLQQQKARSFVGNNPGSCFNLISNVLVSYSCTDLFTNIKTHVPASASLPTYTQNNPNIEVLGYTEGILKTKEGNVLLIHSPQNSEIGPSHFLYLMQANLSTNTGIELNDLDIDQSYSLKPYKDGFIIYSTSFSHVLYYPSTKSRPTTINLDKPKTSGVKAIGLNTLGDTITTLYTTGTNAKASNTTSEVIVNQGGTSRHYVFNVGFSNVNICADQTLCAVTNKAMNVYDISQQKAHLSYMVSGVTRIDNSSHGFLAVTNEGVLNLDIAQRTGFLEYSFGDYKFNGLAVDAAGYVVSVTDNKDKKIALAIDQNNTNSDSIDKKVAELQKSEGVLDVSAYGKFIYVSPDLGQPKYLPSIKGFGYDPALRTSTATKINAEVQQLGIDKNKYIVINLHP